MRNIRGTIIWLFLGAPIPALAYCLAAAYTSDKYDKYTKTHCGSPNFAMSVSEATSVPESSQTVWLCAVLLHVYPRIFEAKIMFKYFVENVQGLRTRTESWWASWIHADWIIASIEWFSLLGLTLLTSHGRIFAIHEAFVGTWLGSSILHMITSSYLERFASKRSSLAKFRRALAILTIFGEFFMVSLYFRHNNYCEPYVYSYFCLCEYSVILINMLYHMAAPPLIQFPVSLIKGCLTKDLNPAQDHPEKKVLLEQ